MGKNQHVVPHANGWAVRGAGNARATTVHQTQAEAISRARGIAQNQQSELLIHGRNGQIRERDSFGNDPYPPKAEPRKAASLVTRPFVHQDYSLARGAMAQNHRGAATYFGRPDIARFLSRIPVSAIPWREYTLN